MSSERHLLEVALSEEIRAALATHGFVPRRVFLVSPLGDAKGRRCAYRVEDARGRRVKARLFERPDEAQRVCALRADLEPAFVPALARYGAVVIEEWIEGAPLAAHDWDVWMEPAGALLGRLHTHPLPPDAPETTPTHRWIEDAESNLEILDAEGMLTSAEIRRLRTEIPRHDPGVSSTVRAHLDFCADNMLIDVHGRLRVIDNEQIAIRPPGFDLGRTFHLWPMADESWKRFRRGYRSSGPPGPDAIGFWRLIATLLGARIFLHRDAARRDAALALLRRLLAGEYLSDER